MVDRIAHPVATSSLLSPEILVIAQWAHEQCSHGDNVDFINQGQPGYGYQRVSSQPSVETNTESPVWNHSQGEQSVIWLAGCLHWITVIMGGPVLGVFVVVVVCLFLAMLHDL